MHPINTSACALIFNIKMTERELQFESEQFLLELARHPDSVHKSPSNDYQHFVNAFVTDNLPIIGAWYPFRL